MKPGNQTDTVADNKRLITQKKLKKIFGHLNPLNPPKVCPVRDILSPVSDKWSILIFIFLGINGIMRFNNLKKYIHGISSKILTERLKFLEQDGYIERKVYAEIPIRVEYQLTDFGYAFVDRLISLLEWINTSMPEIQKKRHNLNSVLNLKD